LPPGTRITSLSDLVGIRVLRRYLQITCEDVFKLNLRLLLPES
jgi:hypothetical protein